MGQDGVVGYSCCYPFVAYVAVYGIPHCTVYYCIGFGTERTVHSWLGGIRNARRLTCSCGPSSSPIHTSVTGSSIFSRAREIEETDRCATAEGSFYGESTSRGPRGLLHTREVVAHPRGVSGRPRAPRSTMIVSARLYNANSGSHGENIPLRNRTQLLIVEGQDNLFEMHWVNRWRIKKRNTRLSCTCSVCLLGRRTLVNGLPH